MLLHRHEAWAMQRAFDFWFWLIVCSLIVAATVMLSGIGSAAQAHEATNVAGQPTGWKYPWACCSNMDCKMVDAKAISERPEGYVIGSTGEVVAYGDKRVKDSPDGEYHWCAHQAGIDAGHTICLFVPPKGF
jgi:hypothetical protein